MDGGADEERHCRARGVSCGEPGQQDAIGLPFKKLVARPKETIKEIKESFVMVFTPDVEQALDATLNDSKTQKNVKFIVPDEWSTCDLDEIGKWFCFNKDNFNDNINLVGCWNGKALRLVQFFFLRVSLNDLHHFNCEL